MNKVELVGRLVKDVELKMTNANKVYARFTLAVPRRFKSKKDGAPDADFISCVAWEGAADVLNKYTKKGSRVGIVGSIQTGSFDGKNGKVYTTDVLVSEIELLESKEKVPTVEDEKTNVPSNSSIKPSDLDLDDGFVTESDGFDEEDLPF